MLDRFTWLVDGLVVDADRMRANLESSHGLVFSQRVLSALVADGLARDEAYRLVQRHAMQAWEEGFEFRELVEADPDIAPHLDPSTFDLADALKHVDAIFERLSALTTQREEAVHA
jgi:adenylosuccinate lyase